MAVPPVLIQRVETSTPWADEGGLFQGLEIDFDAGDLIVVQTFNMDPPTQQFNAMNAEDDLLEFDEIIHGEVSGKTTMQMYAAVAASGGTNVEITGTAGSSGRYVGMVATVWRNHGGLGTVQTVPSTGSGSAPSWSFTTTQPNSAILAQVGDAAAVAGATGNWQVSPAVTDGDFYQRDSTGAISSYYSAIIEDAGSAGAKTLGISTPATMNWLAIGAEVLPGIAPEFTDDPEVTGTPKIGEPLSCSAGTAGGAPAPTVTRQWQRNGGAGWVDIDGENSASFTPSNLFLGDGARCVVTHTNPLGSDTAVSNEVGPIEPDDLAFTVRLTGGASNDDPALSLGGTESSEEAGIGLFPDYEYGDYFGSGLQRYRIVTIHNDDDEDGVVVAYITTQLGTGREIAIGAMPGDPGDPLENLTDDETAPDDVVFVTPASAGTGLDLGVVPAGEPKGIAVRLTVLPGTDPAIANPATIRFEIGRVP